MVLIFCGHIWSCMEHLKSLLRLGKNTEDRSLHSQLLGANIKGLGGHVTEGKIAYMPQHPHPIKVHITMTTIPKLS